MSATEHSRSLELAGSGGNSVGESGGGGPTTPDTTPGGVRKRKGMGTARVGPTTRETSASWVRWNSVSEVLGQPFNNLRIPLSKLEHMRRDAMLAFGLLFIKMPLLRASWYIKSNDARIASAIDNAIRPVWGSYILSYLNCMDYGYSPICKRFELCLPDWAYLDHDNPTSVEQRVWDEGTVQFLTLKDPVALNPRKARPAWDTNGDFNGIHYLQQKGIPGSSKQSTTPDIPLQYALWATNERDSVFGSLYGYPRLGYAYPFWWDYWFKFQLATRAFERWADPPTVVYHPSENGLDAEGNSIDYGQDALETAEKVRSGVNIALPSSVVVGYDERQTNVREWVIEQLKSEVNFSELRSEWDYLDVMKLRALAIPEQALIEGKGGTSSRNVQKGNMDSFMENQVVLAWEFAQALNRWVIPQIRDANFGPEAAEASVVITGFHQIDDDVAKQVITMVGNKDPTRLPVDLRAILDQYNIPMMTAKAMQTALEEQAKAAAATAPPVDAATAPGAGGTGAAGVVQAPNAPPGTHLYMRPQESINLQERTLMITMERVDEIEGHEQAVAFFEARTATLFVRRDADSALLSEYVAQLQSRAAGMMLVDGNGYRNEDTQGLHLTSQLEAVRDAEVMRMREDIDELKRPEIHVHTAPIMVEAAKPAEITARVEIAAPEPQHITIEAEEPAPAQEVRVVVEQPKPHKTIARRNDDGDLEVTHIYEEEETT